MKSILCAFVLCAAAFAQLPLPTNSTLQGVAGTATAITYTVSGSESILGMTPHQVILAQGQLPTTIAPLYTTPDQRVAMVTGIILANTTGSSVSGVKLAVNGSAAANQILGSLTIPASGMAVYNAAGWHIYDGNGDIYATGTQAFGSSGGVATTPGALGATGSALTAARSDHAHQSPGACASIAAASSAIANSETQVVGCTLPANFMQAGTTFRVTAAGTVSTTSAPGNDTFNIRIGTTSLSGNIPAAITAAANVSATSQPFYLSFLVTVRTAGASGSAVGQGIVWSTNASTGAFTSTNIIGTTTATVAVDTTAQKIVELTFGSGASTSSATFLNAELEIVKL
jgi:hypothetical protein